MHRLQFGETVKLIHATRSFFSSLLLALLAVATASVVAFAADQSCSGSLGAVTVDNLTVPANATCSLSGTQIQGTLKVEVGATLNATAITVIGNIQAEAAKAVSVTANSKVGGNIQLKQGGSATIRNVNVNGDIQVEANSGAFSAANNLVGAICKFSKTQARPRSPTTWSRAICNAKRTSLRQPVATTPCKAIKKINAPHSMLLPRPRAALEIVFAPVRWGR